MTTREFYVAVVFALVGYWGVAAVIRHFSTRSAAQKAAPASSADADTDAAPHWSITLEVDRNAGIDAIEAAYKNKLARYAPEQIGNLGPEFLLVAEQKTKEIQAAYERAILGQR